MTQNDAMIQPVFAHRVAHDVRSPLTAIQMCADLLIRDEPEPRARYVRMIAEQARAINWAMESLVALADAEDQVSAGAQAELGQCLECCCNELVPLLNLRNIVLQYLQLPGPVYVVGDENHISLALRSCGEAILTVIPEDGQLSIETVDSDTDHVAMKFTGLPISVSGISKDSILAVPRMNLLSAKYIIEATGGTLAFNHSAGDQIIIDITFMHCL